MTSSVQELVLSLWLSPEQIWAYTNFMSNLPPRFESKIVSTPLANQKQLLKSFQRKCWGCWADSRSRFAFDRCFSKWRWNNAIVLGECKAGDVDGSRTAEEWGIMHHLPDTQPARWRHGTGDTGINDYLSRLGWAWDMHFSSSGSGVWKINVISLQAPAQIANSPGA